MDETDAAILRAINWHPLNPVDAERQPYGLWDVARLLGVHGNTVKRRIQDLEEAGILGGVGVFPNALDVGLQVTGCYFHFNDADAAIAAEQTLLADNRPGVVTRLVGNIVMGNVAVARDADVAQGVEAMRKRLGASKATIMTPRQWPPAELSELERRALWSLTKNAFSTPPEMGKDLGVTPKTVRRCIASLRSKRSFIVVPFISFADVTGLLPMYLDVDAGGDVAAMHRVLRAAPQLFMGGTPQANVLSFTGFARNPRAQSELVERLRALPGVRQVTPQGMLSWKWTGVPDAVQRASDGLARLAEWDDLA